MPTKAGSNWFRSRSGPAPAESIYRTFTRNFASSRTMRDSTAGRGLGVLCHSKYSRGAHCGSLWGADRSPIDDTRNASGRCFAHARTFLHARSLGAAALSHQEANSDFTRLTSEPSIVRNATGVLVLRQVQLPTRNGQSTFIGRYTHHFDFQWLRAHVRCAFLVCRFGTRQSGCPAGRALDSCDRAGSRAALRSRLDCT